MRSVEALEHAERASNLYLRGEKRSLGVGRAVRRQALGEIVGEPFEGQVHALDGTLVHIEDVIDGDSVHPRLELAAKVELRRKLIPPFVEQPPMDAELRRQRHDVVSHLFNR
jgi:hypothetical protein